MTTQWSYQWLSRRLCSKRRWVCLHSVYLFLLLVRQLGLNIFIFQCSKMNCYIISGYVHSATPTGTLGKVWSTHQVNTWAKIVHSCWDGLTNHLTVSAFVPFRCLKMCKCAWTLHLRDKKKMLVIYQCKLQLLSPWFMIIRSFEIYVYLCSEH